MVQLSDNDQIPGTFIMDTITLVMRTAGSCALFTFTTRKSAGSPIICSLYENRRSPMRVGTVDRFSLKWYEHDVVCIL